MYVQRFNGDKASADQIAIYAILFATLISVAVSSVSISYHGRLLSLWLGHGNVVGQVGITLSFAAGAAAYGYQLLAGVMIRSGAIVAVARRQYLYLFTSAVIALIAHLSRAPTLYLALLAGQEILLAGLFVSALGPTVRRVSVMAFSTATGLLAVLTLLTRLDSSGIFDSRSPRAIGESLALSVVTISLAVMTMLLG